MHVGGIFGGVVSLWEGRVIHSIGQLAINGTNVHVPTSDLMAVQVRTAFPQAHQQWCLCGGKNKLRGNSTCE